MPDYIIQKPRPVLLQYDPPGRSPQVEAREARETQQKQDRLEAQIEAKTAASRNLRRYVRGTATLATLTALVAAGTNPLANLTGSHILGKPFHGNETMAPYAVVGALSASSWVILLAVLKRYEKDGAAVATFLGSALGATAIFAATGAAGSAFASQVGFQAQTARDSAQAGAVFGAILTIPLFLAALYVEENLF